MNSPHTDEMLDLAALYALGAVDATECAAVRSHILSCDVCSKEYAAAKAAAGGLAASVATAPPARLRATVMAAVAARPRAKKVVSIFQRKRFYAAVAAVAAAVVALFVFYTPSGSTWPLACLPTPTACTVRGRVVAAGGVLRLEATGFSALPAGKVYQSWAIQPGGKIVPEPTFIPNGGGRGSVDIPSGQPRGTTIAVTVEPAGGSEAPTTKPFVAATLD
ncbi:MAG TPA: anti-sigma factor [Candidatus Eremiobacteraceae bacterium]|nr:anti-sigma factor [Candidatus Eremiobacteraceae bacterium]